MISGSPDNQKQTPNNLELPPGFELVGRHALDLSHVDSPVTDGIVEFEGEKFFGQATSELQASIDARGSATFEAQLTSLTERILSDPFGETSIDAYKDTDAGRLARVVHEVTGELADLIPGKRLAIKGTGMGSREELSYLEMGGTRRSTLQRQFETTAKINRLQKQRAGEGSSLLRVNEVYGVFITPPEKPGDKPREWMLMELIPDAEHVENKRLALSRGGTTLGFEASNYPELAAYASDPFPPRQGALIMFSDVAEKMNKELGLFDRMSPLGDLNGNNLLEQQTPKGPKYTIIDLQSV